LAKHICAPTKAEPGLPKADVWTSPLEPALQKPHALKKSDFYKPFFRDLSSEPHLFGEQKKTEGETKHAPILMLHNL